MMARGFSFQATIHLFFVQMPFARAP